MPAKKPAEVMVKTINRYIRREFLSIFSAALCVLTFIMCVGVLLRAIDLVARGLPAAVVLRFFFNSIPKLLTYTIPICILIACLLLFGRLSSDSEIVALRASGISLFKISAPVLTWAVLLGLLCFFLTCHLGPKAAYANRTLLVDITQINPANLLDEGRFTEDIPGFKIYIARRKANAVYDILIYEIENGRIRRSVRAKKGHIKIDPQNRQLLVDLYDVRINEPDDEDPMDPSRTRHIAAEHYPLKMDFSSLIKEDETTLSKKRNNLTFMELLDVIGTYAPTAQTEPDQRQQRERLKMLVEANQRLVLSLSCFTFALLGIPLGITSHRKDSLAGIVISLGIVFVFYGFIIAAKSLNHRPEFYPHFSIWIPVLTGHLAGLVLLVRIR